MDAYATKNNQSDLPADGGDVDGGAEHQAA